MTTVDLAVLAMIFVFALIGMRSGFVGGLLALIGFLAGAAASAWVAPRVLPGGEASPYAPLVALLGAAVGGAVLASALERVGMRARRLLPIPFLGTLDRGLGLWLGALTGLGVVWLCAIVLVQVPGAEGLRPQLRASKLLQAIGQVMPTTTEVLGVIGRFDPLPVVAGVSRTTLSKPDHAVLSRPAVRSAGGSVVRIRALSCGFAIEGSGWVGDPGYVVTNAHVVAGDQHPTVEVGGRWLGLNATVVTFDRRNDLAVLRVPGLRARAMSTAAPRSGSMGVALGYPLDGGFRASEVSIGRVVAVLGDDAYGVGPISRNVLILRGVVRPGNSGGPVIDSSGLVVGTVYGRSDSAGPAGGFAVPVETAIEELQRARSGAADPVGPCTR